MDLSPSKNKFENGANLPIQIQIDTNIMISHSKILEYTVAIAENMFLTIMQY